jgi:hypothetical protein
VDAEISAEKDSGKIAPPCGAKHIPMHKVAKTKSAEALF